jgi:hypothetical protein
MDLLSALFAGLPLLNGVVRGGEILLNKSENSRETGVEVPGAGDVVMWIDDPSVLDRCELQAKLGACALGNVLKNLPQT